jgi:uncharacterized membrane protein
MSESIAPWLHVAAVAVWLGPQFFMFLVTAPALRAIDNPEIRIRVMRIILYRFGWMAWAAMGVIVLTGISNLFQEASDFGHVFDSDFRYFHVFSTKMALLGLVVLLTALHTFVVGPRQLRMHEEMRSDSPDALRLRQVSIAISSLILLTSLAVLFAGILLANHEYSFRAA